MLTNNNSIKNQLPVADQRINKYDNLTMVVIFYLQFSLLIVFMGIFQSLELFYAVFSMVFKQYALFVSQESSLVDYLVYECTELQGTRA